ncbi:MAG TPA: c-type cytochrome [Beijerinckiaceae bacterium]|jgi:cytochrome c553
MAARPRLFLALALLCGAPGPALPETLAERLQPCLACHGEKGTSQTPEVPSLGGQPASFVLIQLYVFREKQRIAEPMNTLTEGMTDDDLRDFSEEIAKLPPPAPPPEGAEPARLESGRAAAARHRCGFCHNPDLSGHDQIPRIGAQREDYLVKALSQYKTGERHGYDPAMVEVAQPMSEAEIADVAHYLAHWRP